MTATGTRWKTKGFVALCIVTMALGITVAKMTKAELQEAMNDNQIVGDWNYDDIDGALRRAAKEDKPVLVVFR